MRNRRRLVVTGVATVLLLAPAAAASAAPGDGGCKKFGQNVSGLATGLPPGEFGDRASDTASSKPGAFPAKVVHPEQDAACQ